MTPEPFLGEVDRTPVTHHILSVLVENKAGVLARIAGLFARRGFNIYSLRGGGPFFARNYRGGRRIGPAGTDCWPAQQIN
jgi:hypothetical protein